ncbi:RAD52 DNA repair protein [Mycena vulgaris]|nr:RAD52 DNA repair protein [Mycena vulgaris]
MAGPLSGHILNSYESSISNQSICTDGLISFNPNMHGSFNPNLHSTQQQSFGLNSLSHASTSMGESTYDRVSRLQAKLNQKLGPEFISQRPGPGGGPKLTYAEGWKVINVANEVFGFEGWSSNIVSLTTDYMDYNEETRRYNVGVSAVMRVTLKEGVFHEDVGYGMIENAKAKGMALDKCKKEAVTDGLKRTLRTFGNVMGNCLYDKQYTAEIVKIKVPPTKLEKGDLYRLAEFSDKPPAGASMSANRSVNATSTPIRAPAPAAQPQRWQPQPQPQLPQPQVQQPAKSISSVPRHLQPSGLQTPITTPIHPQAERKVSFVPQVKAESSRLMQAPPQAQPKPLAPPSAQVLQQDLGDDSFSFFSDDDAFLACVDMGEGDLGQPIDFEEGTGSSVVSTTMEEAKAPAFVPQVETNQQQQEEGARSGFGRTGQGTRQPGTMNPPPNPQQQRGYPANAQGANGTATSRGAPPKPISGGSAAPSRPTDASSSVASFSRPPTTAANARSGPSTVNANQNQNHKPPSTGQTASESGPTPAPPPPAAKRPPTPSVGGFHFPPGMPNPLLQNTSRPPPPLPQGVKRGADSMMGSSVRSGVGLGLSDAGGVSGSRQPLGTLALDAQQYHQQGGDPKRVKR